MNKEILEAARKCDNWNTCLDCPLRDVADCRVSFAKAITEHDERYIWHDLLKNPDDLPEDDSKDYFVKEVWVDGDVIYTSAGRDYIVHHGIPTDVYNFTVVAWREIEPFEREE